MDVIALAQHGVAYAVATLGTATTPIHVQKLLRAADEIIFCFDGDAAGRRAAWRALENALGALTDTARLLFLFLPEGEDPDTFVKSQGPAALTARLKDSIDVFERKIQLLERAGMFSELQKKRRALDRLLPTVRVTADGIMRDLYLSRASEVSGVAREVLERELTGRSAPPAAASPKPVARPAS